MAVTKIKPIRGTVNKALAYILDPQKTDDAFYVPPMGALQATQQQKNLNGQETLQCSKECRCRRYLPVI